ncbi:MAG TPA: hypothetical protein VJV78_40830 [Polyangiales bacterium]|nr:hypothetical protein [Polyangiales bacterium]
MGPIRRLFEAHRQRLSRLIGLLGVVVVGLVLLPHVPRKVDVEFELPPSHREIVEVRVAYVKDGEELHGVSFSFPDGAPGQVRHSVSLPPGDFEVHTELRPSHGLAHGSVEKLHTPADGLVRIWLKPDAP